jgi:hypothetical protein
MKIVKLTKIYLKETGSEVHRGKHFSDTFPVENSLKEGDALSPLLFQCCFVLTIRKVQETQVGLNLNGRHQLLVYTDGR